MKILRIILSTLFCSFILQIRVSAPSNLLSLNKTQNSTSQNVKIRDEPYRSYTLMNANPKGVASQLQNSENSISGYGNVLTIDRDVSFKKIAREVYYTTVAPNLKYCVLQAGNFTPYAGKSGASALKPDGRAESTKTFLWFDLYLCVTSRSEIYVPQKLKNNKTKAGAAEFALTVSSSGISANIKI